MSGCRSSVAEHWLHKPGVLGSIPSNCRPFCSPLFCLKISKISLDLFRGLLALYFDLATCGFIKIIINPLCTHRTLISSDKSAKFSWSWLHLPVYSLETRLSALGSVSYVALRKIRFCQTALAKNWGFL